MMFLLLLSLLLLLLLLIVLLLLLLLLLLLQIKLLLMLYLVEMCAQREASILNDFIYLLRSKVLKLLLAWCSREVIEMMLI